MEQFHATTIDLDGRGVMLRGPSGSGKSDLGLRLIDGGARLVADDRTDLTLSDGTLTASAPAELAGRLEIRGVGIVSVPSVSQSALALIVDLVNDASVERLPEPETVELLGLALPLVRLAPFEASAPAKVRTALSLYCTL
ncbi:MAG: serine/threonine protein kinase [Alphaproteobacteria bacterium]|nr:serine/threonine protein kinase [Alphaproteobacteria bacterium]